MKVINKRFIVGEQSRGRYPYLANFDNTGLALIGVLKRRETLEQWLIRKENRERSMERSVLFTTLENQYQTFIGKSATIKGRERLVDEMVETEVKLNELMRL